MSDSGLAGVATTSKTLLEGLVATSAPLVSISIITYNQVRWIRGCIESALAQDYPNIEIVVADDGSTDGTADVVRSMASEHPGTVKPVLSPANEGITANSNRALRACTGKYVALCAGDDVLLPGKLSKPVAWLEEDESRVLCGHYIDVMDEKLETSQGVYRTGLAGETGKGCALVIRYGPGSTFQGSSVMIRRRSAPPSGFDERISIASDWKFLIDTIGEDGVWGIVAEVLCRYRRHEGNVTILRYEAILMDTLKTLDLVESERPWLRSETVPVRRLYEYAWQKSLFLRGDSRADKWKIAADLPNPPPGVPRWKALALFTAMCIGGSGLRAALNAREARKTFLASASPRDART